MLAGAAGGFVVGEQVAPARYAMSNAGNGNIVRMNTRTGEVALFNADCLNKRPVPAKGDACPDPWSEFETVRTKE